MIKLNLPFIAVLTSVWLILLALCALIGILIVPVDLSIDSNFIAFLIGSGKVGISLLAVGIWLLGWYKGMDVLLKIEFYLSEEVTPTDD